MVMLRYKTRSALDCHWRVSREIKLLVWSSEQFKGASASPQINQVVFSTLQEPETKSRLPEKLLLDLNIKPQVCTDDDQKGI